MCMWSIVYIYVVNSEFESVVTVSSSWSDEIWAEGRELGREMWREEDTPQVLMRVQYNDC